MKQRSFFTLIVLGGALVAAILIHNFILGTESHFQKLPTGAVDFDSPTDLLGTMHTGGLLVPALITLTIMVMTFVFERLFSLAKAQGKGNVNAFLKRVEDKVKNGDIQGAIGECDAQRGSCANIIRAGLEGFANSSNTNPDKQIAELRRAIEEAMGLETPLLEKNLIAMSTIASISTMIGLLGTVIGMIRAFRALANTGQASSATQLSIGISEALINTAGGLVAAIIAIVAYNFFTNKVDSFVYTIEESTVNVVELLSARAKS
jgi:biopolymer transport protein ExbB